MADWQPFHEPLRVTLTRTVGIAIVGGAVLSLWTGGFGRWPVLSLLMLWPAVGGHWVDLFFLNWLRPRIPRTRGLQRFARIAVWFAGGVLLALGVRLTAGAIFARPQLVWLTWMNAGALFIATELVAHAALSLRRRPNFFNGLG